DDPAQLAAVVAECGRASLVALHTEATSLDPLRADLVGMALAVAPGRSWYLPFAHVAPDGELAGGVVPRNLPSLTCAELAPLRERGRAAARRRVPTGARGSPARPLARYDRAAAPPCAGGYGVARGADRRRAPGRDFPRVCPRARGARAIDSPRGGDRLQHQLHPPAAACPIREDPAP